MRASGARGTQGLFFTGWTASELAARLGEGWTIEVAQARPRQATDADGRTVTIHDAVLRARRAYPLHQMGPKYGTGTRWQRPAGRSHTAAAIV